jgi:hypothetical protein
MSTSVAAHPTGSSDPRLLAGLMDLEAGQGRVWSAGELAAVFRHQMAAPVQFDLARLGPQRAGQLQLLCEGEGLLLKSFNDLFAHPCPPLELLRLTQEFAKLNRQSQASAIPAAVATVLYYASIATALVRCGVRTTAMSNADLRLGLGRILALPWVTEPIRAICEQARGLLAGTDTKAAGQADAPPCAAGACGGSRPRRT